MMPYWANIALRRGRICLLSIICAALASTAAAQEVLGDTILAGIGISGNSNFVRAVSRGGTQLSNGSPVPFRPWYSSDMPDLRVTMLTPLRSDFGILWGFGTGERGKKYRIEPSLKLGFIASHRPSENSTLSLSVTAVVGGFLKERPCVANYGSIGGVQTVNCRLAASPMRPAETMDYLFDDPPRDRIEIAVTFKSQF